MEGSQAPVYVVVKSYAASMAAVIATLATRSFAYPNAVILHHQISWLGIGNLTQQKEQLVEAEKWWRRLAEPVAKKMGLTLDQLIARMYEKNSDGNWREFADAAKSLKWIDEIVHTIWETALDKNPDRFGSRPMMALRMEEAKDSEGSSYVVLPRLAPFDCYFVYNPDHYYRLR
jgi:ATP-dependent Clp protease protease subunit